MLGLPPRLLDCRCFPKFPPEVMNSAYSMLNTSAGVLSSAAATLQTSFTSGDSNFGNYIADISKGILIIVIGGLACGMVLSLVSECSHRALLAAAAGLQDGAHARLCGLLPAPCGRARMQGA